MAETLRLRSRGDEVRRLQVNLNAAIGARYGRLAADGVFGQATKTAVERYQRDFRLKSVDGVVGPETRAALATRVITIEGAMSRLMTPPLVLTMPRLPPFLGAPPTAPLQLPPLQPAPIVTRPSPFLLQLQPAFGLTPAPFLSRSPGPPGPAPGTVVAGQIAMGLVYRTASEGPHWEFGVVGQPSVNSTNTASDPRYSLQVQGSVSYADPFSKGRFHTSLFGQVIFLQNFSPGSSVLAAQIGGQISVDIIADRWSLFSQAALAGAWTLHDPNGPAGALSFGPAFTLLGTTIQWGL